MEWVVSEALFLHEWWSPREKTYSSLRHQLDNSTESRFKKLRLVVINDRYIYSSLTSQVIRKDPDNCHRK